MKTLLMMVTLLAYASMLVHQNKQSATPVLPDEPKACIEFDQMAARVGGRGSHDGGHHRARIQKKGDMARCRG